MTPKAARVGAALLLLIFATPSGAHDGHMPLPGPTGPDGLRGQIAEAVDRGEPALLEAATAAVTHAIAHAPQDRPRALAGLLILRASLRQSIHDFGAAKADLDRAIALDARNPQARLSRAYLFVTVGDHSAARADCAALPPRRARLARIACAARLASVTGRASAALGLIGQGLDAGAGAAPALQAHLHGMRAEILERLGRTDAARWAHIAAIAALPEGRAPQLAYAAFLLRHGEPARALALAQDHAGPKALLIEARARRRLGAVDPAVEAALEARIAEHASDRGTGHAHEQAEFALWIAFDAKAALVHARENWRQQKEPGDLWLLVAAAEAAGLPTAADNALAWARAQGLEDARLPGLSRTTAITTAEGPER